MPNVSGDDALLEKALKDLSAAWSRSSDGWQDAARSTFAELHLQPIEIRARHGAKAIKQLEALLAEAMRQCS